MSKTREEVSCRRMAMVMALIGGPLLFLTTKALIEPFSLTSHPGKPVRTIFFGDISGWRSFMGGYWLVDMVALIVWMWVMLYILLRGVNSGLDPSGFKDWIRFVAGMSIGFCGLGGTIGTAMEGWFIGLEIALLFGVGLIALLGVLAAALTLMYQVGSWVWYRFEPIRVWLSQTALARWLDRFGGYLHASEAPDPPTSTD